MHVFIYEWVTGGGLLAHPGPLPQSLLREGLAMARAVADDFLRNDGVQVTLLQELRAAQLVVDGADLLTVTSRSEHNAAFDDLCRAADAVLLIAPEIDGALFACVELAESAGAKLISPPSGFVEVASNKQRTAERLDEAGAPTPQGIVLASEDPLPESFRYPAVLKPVDGAGSDGVFVVTGPYDAPAGRVGDHRLEAFVPGLPASVAALTGPAGNVTLPPCTQRLSSDGRLRYLGGEMPLAAGLAGRAKALALTALSALPEARGYVGVDVLLGADPSGAEDCIIEVNPRLTTSYTALRFAVGPNLAMAMAETAAGRAAEIEVDASPIEFTTDGTVSYRPAE